MSTPKWSVGTYKVTIKKERNQLIARDDRGNWRSRGKYTGEVFEPQQAAEYLFHADEIASVKVEDGVLIAWIYTAWEHEVEVPF